MEAKQSRNSFMDHSLNLSNSEVGLDTVLGDSLMKRPLETSIESTHDASGPSQLIRSPSLDDTLVMSVVEEKQQPDVLENVQKLLSLPPDVFPKAVIKACAILNDMVETEVLEFQRDITLDVSSYTRHVKYQKILRDQSSRKKLDTLLQISKGEVRMAVKSVLCRMPFPPDVVLSEILLDSVEGPEDLDYVHSALITHVLRRKQSSVASIVSCLNLAVEFSNVRLLHDSLVLFIFSLSQLYQECNCLICDHVSQDRSLPMSTIKGAVKNMESFISRQNDSDKEMLVGPYFALCLLVGCVSDVLPEAMKEIVLGKSKKPLSFFLSSKKEGLDSRLGFVIRYLGNNVILDGEVDGLIGFVTNAVNFGLDPQCPPLTRHLIGHLVRSAPDRKNLPCKWLVFASRQINERSSFCVGHLFASFIRLLPSYRPLDKESCNVISRALNTVTAATDRTELENPRLFLKILNLLTTAEFHCADDISTLQLVLGVVKDDDLPHVVKRLISDWEKSISNRQIGDLVVSRLLGSQSRFRDIVGCLETIVKRGLIPSLPRATVSKISELFAKSATLESLQAAQRLADMGPLSNKFFSLVRVPETGSSNEWMDVFISLLQGSQSSQKESWDSRNAALKTILDFVDQRTGDTVTQLSLLTAAAALTEQVDELSDQVENRIVQFLSTLGSQDSSIFHVPIFKIFRKCSSVVSISALKYCSGVLENNQSDIVLSEIVHLLSGSLIDSQWLETLFVQLCDTLPNIASGDLAPQVIELLARMSDSLRRSNLEFKSSSGYYLLKMWGRSKSPEQENVLRILNKSSADVILKSLLVDSKSVQDSLLTRRKTPQFIDLMRRLILCQSSSPSTMSKIFSHSHWKKTLEGFLDVILFGEQIDVNESEFVEGVVCILDQYCKIEKEVSIGKRLVLLLGCYSFKEPNDLFIRRLPIDPTRVISQDNGLLFCETARALCTLLDQSHSKKELGQEIDRLRVFILCRGLQRLLIRAILLRFSPVGDDSSQRILEWIYSTRIPMSSVEYSVTSVLSFESDLISCLSSEIGSRSALTPESYIIILSEFLNRCFSLSLSFGTQVLNGLLPSLESAIKRASTLSTASLHEFLAVSDAPKLRRDRVQFDETDFMWKCVSELPEHIANSWKAAGDYCIENVHLIDSANASSVNSSIQSLLPPNFWSLIRVFDGYLKLLPWHSIESVWKPPIIVPGCRLVVTFLACRLCPVESRPLTTPRGIQFTPRSMPLATPRTRATDAEYREKVDLAQSLSNPNSQILVSLLQTFHRLHLDCLPVIPDKTFYLPIFDIERFGDPFHQNLMKQTLLRFPFLVPFDVKRKLFYSRISSSTTDQIVRMTVDRGSVLRDAMKCFSDNFSSSSDFLGEWRIQFSDEKAIDVSGVRREFCSLLGQELSTTVFRKLAQSDDYVPISHSNDDFEMLRFAGRFIGKTIRDKSTIVSFPLSPILLKRILGTRPSINDLESLDPELWKNQICFVRDSDVDGLGLYFTCTEGELEIPLCEGGERRMLTNENKAEYIEKIVQFKQSKDNNAISALREGIDVVIPVSSLQMFSPNELRELISGHSSITAETILDSCSLKFFDNGKQDPAFICLKQVFESLSAEQLSDVLNFVTGSRRMPSGGFDPPFTIQKIDQGAVDQRRLPSASTCWNLLKLPPYTNPSILKEKLLLAATENRYELS